MTRLELQNLVSQWVDDPDKGYFTADIINTFLNNALIEVQKRLILAGENYYIKCVTTPIIANQRDYSLPSDFWGIRRLRVITQGSGVTAVKVDLDMVTMRQEQAFSRTGQPEGFYLSKDRLVLVPAPTNSAWVLEMEYAYIIASMTDDADTPDVPTHFQEYIAILAAYNCFIKDDRVPSNLLEKKNWYEDQLDNSADARIQTNTRMIVVTPEGLLGM